MQQQPLGTLAAPVKGLHAPTPLPWGLQSALQTLINPRRELTDLDYAETNTSEIFKTQIPPYGEQALCLAKSRAPCQKCYCHIMNCSIRVFGRKQCTCQPARYPATPATRTLKEIPRVAKCEVCSKPHTSPVQVQKHKRDASPATGGPRQ